MLEFYFRRLLVHCRVLLPWRSFQEYSDVVILGCVDLKHLGLHLNCDSIPARNESRASRNLRLTY